MKFIFWIVSNVYGKVFGWSFLAPVHHMIVSLSLHALGYGNMYRESWTGEEWFIKKILAPTNPKIIFDIGANIGNCSKNLLRFTDAKIYAFEPNQSSFEKLLLLGKRVVKVNSAISDFEGKSEINFRFACDEKASLDKNICSGYSEVVDVTTVSNFVKREGVESIDYIKIDTEGFEKEVLSGLGKIRPSYIQLEFNINHLQRDCTFLAIAELLPGYSFYRLLPNGWLKISPTKYLNNIFIFSNIVAVRDDK